MSNFIFKSTALAAAVSFLSLLTGCADSTASTEQESSHLFSEADTSVISLEQRSRRKWDNALIADLDQNGHMDVVITEHAYGASVFWNEGGTFSQPQFIIRGDTHGVAAADYDKDGRVDIIISQGGGGGNKPRFPVYFQVNKDRTIEGGKAFDHFERSRGRAVKFVDVNNDGTLNLITSAFPLKTQKQGANFLYEKSAEREFEFVEKLPQAKWLGYNLLVTDFNNDNDSDLIFYGGANMVAVSGGAGASFTDTSKTVLAELANTEDVSSIAEIDFDNDGDFDLFLTRAKHQFERQSSYDAQNQRFAFFARNEKFQFDDLKIAGDFILENLQMAFPDFDVYVGAQQRKMEFTGDRHGHKDLTLSPEQAKGYPENITARGLYIGYLGEGLWRVGGHTKSPTSAVIHNVISVPTTIADIPEPARLFENRNGKFVDVTQQLGIAIPEQTSSAAIGDFNNDGWSDIFVVRYGDMATQTTQILYLNQLGKSFKRLENHGVISKELGATGSGAEAFDYDSDGDLDLFYANERGRWHLFTNNLMPDAKHNYIVVKVAGAPSGKATAQGAVLTLNACGQTYKRVVGATSAAFSHSANNHLHIGLGQCDSVGQALVTWSNGETHTFNITKLNAATNVGI